METTSSGFWFTTLTGVREARPAWAEIAHYLDPVRRYLARYHGRIPEADRDDLAQEVLVAMRERIVAGYDRSRGRFREYLKGAIENKVRDWFRSRRRTPGADLEGDAELLAAPPGDDASAAVDLEAELLRAIRAFHDAHVRAGGDDDLALVYCFGDRLVRGLPEAEIAAREGLSRDQVKRLLARAREEVLAELAGAILERGEGPASEAARARAATLVREGVRRPRERARLLEAEGEPHAREAAEDLLAAIDAARRHFAGAGTEAGRELLRGLEEVFAG